MHKLLSAFFSRLKKDVIFWVVLVVYSVLSLVSCLLTYQSSIQYPSDPVYVEDVLFNMIPALPFLCAAVIALFLGQEFDENTIRNKLTVGHTRTAIFFSAYAACTAASLALLVSTLILSGAAAFLCFKAFLLDWTKLIYLTACCVLITMVFSAICVAFCMNIQKRAISILISLVVMLVLLFAASYLEGALLEPEMTYDGISISMDGVQYGDLVKNPAYVSGSTRTVMELIFDMLPTGQALQLNNMEFERCARWLWMSALMLPIATLAGFLPFRKQDIR